MANIAAKVDSRNPVKRTKRHRALHMQRLGMVRKSIHQTGEHQNTTSIDTNLYAEQTWKANVARHVRETKHD